MLTRGTASKRWDQEFNALPVLGLCSVGTGVSIAVPLIKIDPFSFQRSGCVKPLGRPIKLAGPCQDSVEGRRGSSAARYTPSKPTLAALWLVWLPFGMFMSIIGNWINKCRQLYW